MADRVGVMLMKSASIHKNIQISMRMQARSYRSLPEDTSLKISVVCRFLNVAAGAVICASTDYQGMHAAVGLLTGEERLGRM